jgi:hypothetical protein
MASGAISSASVPQHNVRWKWLLLGLCALSAVWIVSVILDQVGFGGRPWFGWWDALQAPTGQPYRLQMVSVLPNGGSAKSGLRDGDWFDWREQSLDTRERLVAVQPMATQPTTLVVHHGQRVMTIPLIGGTFSEGNVPVKFFNFVPFVISSIWFLSCALLIVSRRASDRVARMVALILLFLTALASLGNSVAVPNAMASMAITLATYLLPLIAQVLLVQLSSCFGRPSVLRRALELCAYGAIAACGLMLAVGVYGALTLRIDPVALGIGLLPSFGSSTIAVVAAVAVAAVEIAATASTPLSGRARTAWLLLPIPLAMLLNTAVFQLGSLTTSWLAGEILQGLAGLTMLIGAVAVTYALLKRRVLDFGFVLNRAVVVSIVGLIVVIAFVLLEWILGSVLTGVSHAAGIIANAALVLVLGVSLNFIHKRVDASVDTILFRKRHDNTRALQDFSKEAAYVTGSEALLEQSIAKIQSHTDACTAAILLQRNGCFSPVRSFGESEPSRVDENDGGILALKTWHKPLDPHHYGTSLKGALAVPMVARGRLLGVLSLGERAGGEAYAPDEVEALSQFAHGVASALDALSLSAEGSRDGILDAVLALGEQIRSLPDAIAVRLR